MTRIARLFILAFALLITVASCRTAQKFVERGDYDGAIEFCVDRLAGRKKKKIEHVQGLELAFQKATERDMRAADALRAENRPDNWAKINRLYENIQYRQETITPLLPLTSNDGYTAKFQFVNIEKLLSESRTEAAEYEYQRGLTHMEQARAGDKSAARRAYNAFDNTSKYFDTYKNASALKDEMHRLGTVHILFSIENNSNTILPVGFEDRVLDIQPADLNTFWRKYYADTPKNIKTDYHAVWHLESVDMSPERIQERITTETREIEDGFEFVYNQDGSVKKDSLNNPIKQRRYVQVRAEVLEARQTKAARLGGTIRIYEMNGQRSLESHSLGTEMLFDHCAVTYRGDERALCDDTRRRVGIGPVPFPTDQQLMAQAADRLRPDIRHFLSGSRILDN
jgi:hypothetical protein